MSDRPGVAVRHCCVCVWAVKKKKKRKSYIRFEKKREPENAAKTLTHTRQRIKYHQESLGKIAQLIFSENAS